MGVHYTYCGNRIEVRSLCRAPYTQTVLCVNCISVKLEGGKNPNHSQVRCVAAGEHTAHLLVQWELAPEGPLFLLLLAQGCPGGPAPVSVQAAFLLRLLLGYAFLLVPLIDDFLKNHTFQQKLICLCSGTYSEQRQNLLSLYFP